MKRLLTLPATLATALVLAACGGSPATTTAPTSGAGAGTSATSATLAEPTTAATSGTAAEPTTAATSGTGTGATMQATSATTGATSAATTGATSATTGATSAATSAAGTSVAGTPVTGTAAAATPAASGEGDLLAAAQSDPQLKTLAAAIQAAGLEQTLKGVGPYTIFAPSDQAFASLPPATLQALLADPAMLGKILSYHVAQGAITSAQLSTTTSVPTLEGQPLQFEMNGGAVSIDGKARVLSKDIQTSNGVIHVIDQVLLPPGVTLPAGS